MLEESENHLLFVNPLLSMFPFSSLESVHALNAMDASLTHSLAATNMGASELAARLQKYLDTQKQHTERNNSEGYECKFQHLFVYLNVS